MYNRYNAANVMFLYAVNIEKYDVYVTDPFRNTNQCGSFDPILIDQCINGTLKNSELTKNWARSSKVAKILPNCEFKFCARISEPFVNEGCKSGLEMQIISVLQEILKFKVSEQVLKYFYIM